jgi:hypothetical protein
VKTQSDPLETLTPPTPSSSYAEIAGSNRLELIKSHAHGDVGCLDHLGELFKADLAVAVKISFHNGLINNLMIIR